jgi:Arc/MetJ-type ribon-helix-helix transcriptional regulator
MDRKQINVRLDDVLLAAIEDIRGMMRPIPSRSAVIRQAVLHERDRVKRQLEREDRGDAR